MEYKTSIDIFKKYFEHKFAKSLKTLDKSAFPGNPFVSISRTTGAGGVNFPKSLSITLTSRKVNPKING
ncbi:MAG: hypothetical protein WC644_13210 [Ignavibacteria bacterium]